MSKRDYAQTRWIPEGSTEQKHPEGLGVVYCYERPSRHRVETEWLAVAYIGKGEKPSWHIAYRTEERRAADIAEFWRNLEGHRERMAERRKVRAMPTGAKVGDILHTSWGYDQTNVEYFEIVAVRGKVVDLRELAREVVCSTGSMSEVVRPVQGKYLDKPALCGKRPSGYGKEGDYTVRIDDVRTAFLGGGERHTSSYA